MMRLAGLTLVFGLLLATGPALAAEATVEPIPDALWEEMQGKSWHAGLDCPGREELALVSVPYTDFDGEERRGQLVVASRVAEDVAAIFEAIHATGALRIARIEPVDAFDGSDDASMGANNTSAFNCRLKTGGKTLSAHSFGIAIDINPVQNPFVSKSRTLPDPEGRPYDTPNERMAKLKAKATGVIGPKSAVVKLFKSRGWKWGGDWKFPKDYQHFSLDGS